MSEITTTRLKLSEIKPNPNNPRFIRDDNFKKLVKSLRDFPEMIEARELVLNTDHVILGGNMRYKAAKEAGIAELPVKIVDWSEDKQREFIIKDNVSGGEWDWDILANEWGEAALSDWGMDLPSDWGVEDINTPTPDKTDEGLSTIVVVAFDDINDLDAITALYNLEAIDMPASVKEELGGQRKAYVFKK